MEGNQKEYPEFPVLVVDDEKRKNPVVPKFSLSDAVIEERRSFQ